MDGSNRKAIFISHSNPEDNAFARWLGAKLVAMGYEVWADVLRLSGGKDWSRELEDALRNRSAKMLLVATSESVEKQGVRNEIQIAAETSKKINDNEFIIPLRLAPYEAPFLIAHAQYIDFGNGWTDGFVELIRTLKEDYRLEPGKQASIQAWCDAQASGSKELVTAKEYLVSNWLEIKSFPERVYYLEPPHGFALDQFTNRSSYNFPVVPFGEGLISFLEPNDKGYIAPDILAKTVRSSEVDKFLRFGWEEYGIEAFEARRIVVDLCNQAADNFLLGNRLNAYELSSGRRVWWGDIKTYPHSTISFDWKYHQGRRKVIGSSGKRGVHWHFAVLIQAKTFPINHFKLSSKLIFSENGLDALEDKNKMHRLRRSFAKSWRNARWRDMMLSFLWWLSKGEKELRIPVSLSESILIKLPPLAFKSIVSVSGDDVEELDEDDPDVDYEEWEDDSIPTSVGFD